MTIQNAKEIIFNAVTTTKPRWQTFVVRWKDADRIFLLRAYEQGGFEAYKFVELLDQEGIGSIQEVGKILESAQGLSKSYSRPFAGALDSPFWVEMSQGKHGVNGRKLAHCVRRFLSEKPGKPGAFFWRQVWNMMNACAFFNRVSSGSFAEYLKRKLAEACGRTSISDAEFVSVPSDTWRLFVERCKPYKDIMGVGENVFDFLMGDFDEAKFARDCFKFDASNSHFLKVTGISDLIVPFDRDHTIAFIRSLDLPYTLREVNRGIYAYSSETEAKHYGFCRSSAKCAMCGVKTLCDKRLLRNEN